MKVMYLYKDVDAESPLDCWGFEVTYNPRAREVIGNTPLDYEDAVERLRSGKYLAWPVYAYIHGYVALRMGEGWSWGELPEGHAYFDSGMTGYIMVAKKTVMEEWLGCKRLSKKAIGNIRGQANSCIKDYEAYINGDCWYATIFDIDENEDDVPEEGDWSNSVSGYGDSWEEIAKEYGITTIIDKRWE